VWKAAPSEDSTSQCRHELDHDAESVFWLLVYWIVQVQPKGKSKECIDSAVWGELRGNPDARTG
jgi:hypothetical protein